MKGNLYKWAGLHVFFVWMHTNFTCLFLKYTFTSKFHGFKMFCSIGFHLVNAQQVETFRKCIQWLADLLCCSLSLWATCNMCLWLITKNWWCFPDRFTYEPSMHSAFNVYQRILLDSFEIHMKLSWYVYLLPAAYLLMYGYLFVLEMWCDGSPTVLEIVVAFFQPYPCFQKIDIFHGIQV